MKLPLSIAAFFQAFNAHDAAVFMLFAEDAMVADEGRTHRGAEIKAWIEKVYSDYKPHAEVISSVRVAGKYTVTAQISGTFPGSPIELRYAFSLQKSKIIALKCDA